MSGVMDTRDHKVMRTVGMLAVLGVVGCSSPAAICPPGATQVCVCASGANGAQRCADDGMRWEECRCEVAALVPVPATTASSPPQPTPSEPLPSGAEAPPEAFEAPRPRPMIDMIGDYRTTDVGDRFVWIRTQDTGVGDRAQLHCGAQAREAARRAVARFSRDDISCDDHSCTYGHEGGIAAPYLFGAPAADGSGALLIGYWNGLAGDARRERVERWLAELECGQIVDVRPAE